MREEYMIETSREIFETASSRVVDRCQVCESSNLDLILFLGYLPPVNTMPKIGSPICEQPSYPAQLMCCQNCFLVQLGLVVDAKILFPSDYPYTSSTTKILRDNFSELYQECRTIIDLSSQDLIVDIGSNDGNLLSNFKGDHRVLGITPEEIGRIAIKRGIPTLISYFNRDMVQEVKTKYGAATIVTATNVFAHMENINGILSSILEILDQEGLFISESHYLLSLIETLQYDTIYHEHLRYYSLHSLKYLLESHGLEIIHAKKIPTHGGSIRVYAARKGMYAVKASVFELLNDEKKLILNREALLEFRRQVVLSKLKLHSLLLDILKQRKRVYGIGAPSRASTLINYVGIDDGMLQCVLEVEGSHKIGKYIPGTLIPVLKEAKLYEDQPEYALLFSWHIADELVPKIRQKGFKGSFIIPLPTPRIVVN